MNYYHAVRFWNACLTSEYVKGVFDVMTELPRGIYGLNLAGPLGKPAADEARQVARFLREVADAVESRGTDPASLGGDGE